MFELSQLQCFTAVATELSFRRAAQRLNMTQPPLSRQIQLLEHQLGVQLFERSTRTVRLTAAGLAFFTEANHLLEQAQHAAQTVKRIARGEMGSVTISFISSAVYEYLPDVIHRVRREHPDIAIQLKEMPTAEQLTGIRLRQIDIGIIRASPQPHGFAAEPLLNEPFILAVPADHPLAVADTLTPECLHQQPFITYSPSGWQPFYEMIAAAFRRHRILPRYEHAIGSTVTILSMVNGGMGLALVPACSESIRFANVVYRALDLDPGLRSELSLVWRDDNTNPVLPVLLGALRQSVFKTG